MFFLLFFVGGVSGWEDSKENKQIFKMIYTINLAVGTLESQTCRKSNLAKEGYEALIELVLNTVDEGQVSKKDSFDMLAATLEARQKQRSKANSSESCKGAEDLVNMILKNESN